MKPEYKKYISEHIDKKSIGEIAKELGIKERKVKKFLEKSGIRKTQESKWLNTAAKVNGDLKEKFLKKIRYSKTSNILIFLAIVLIAFAVRWIYLNQIKTNPFFIPFYRGLDDYLYDNWAQNIANGDILGREVFYGLPLYPYFLGFTYFLFGHSIFIAKAVQFFIGSLSCGLIYLIGQKIFNRTIGILASAMLIFYAMAIYFEGFFVSAFLAIFLNCIIILLLLSANDRPHWLKWISAGFLIGLSSLASASVLVFLPFLILWTFQSFKTTPKTKIVVYLVTLFIGISLAIAPVTIRNYIVGKDFVPITAHGGITFYAGNNPLSDGSFHLPKDIGAGVIDGRKNSKAIAERNMKRELKPSEVSKFWFNQSLAFMREEPHKFLKLTVKKIFLFWNAHEIPDVLPLSFFKQYSSLLKLPLFNFSVICPLALFGIFLCIKLNRSDIRLLYLFIISTFLSTIIYFVNSRYRLLAVPYLIIFSAVAIYWFYGKIISRKFNALIFPVIGIFALSILIHMEILEFRHAQAYNSLGIILKRKGLHQEAIDAYKSAIKLDPGYNTPHFNLGLLYLEKIDYDKAIDSFKKALQIYPDFPEAHKKLGMAYIAIGEKDKALLHWKTSLELDLDQNDVRELIAQHSR
jgi:tetratricopeptide (TPR) repeat protein